MDWSAVDFKALERLRAAYLAASPISQDYWRSESDLASYDFSFGARIGWKWDFVLKELALRGWSPPKARLVDWGCGTGVASRRCLRAWGPEAVDRADLFDRSGLAGDFAAKALRAATARGHQQGADRGAHHGPPISVPAKDPDFEGSIVLLSHVLGELDEAAEARLVARLAAAEAVLWLEPGTPELSRRLIAIRSKLLKSHRVIAPCTHAGTCGMLAPGNERHWCHSFATPPQEVFHEKGWKDFGDRMGIDLRSLPLSFLVMDSRPAKADETDYTRVIGRAREYKGYSKILACHGQQGVREFILQKRDAADLLKDFQRGRAATLYKFRFEQDKIRSGETYER